MADARHTTVMICINYRANNLVDSCGRRGSADVADALEAGIASALSHMTSYAPTAWESAI